jgi:hypothetical protein
MSFPTAFMNAGPPTSAPSLVVVVSSSTPTCVCERAQLRSGKVTTPLVPGPSNEV